MLEININLTPDIVIYVVPPQSWGNQGDTKHSDASS